ncbi:MAG: DNA polymerase III subunit alpha, partial [Chlamydiae bacterium]|nr:DNA polymerase III subunit alpha [Chlamydiota bacterium]
KGRIKNPKREVLPSHAFHFPLEQEIRETFSDYPEAVDQTLEVAKRCSFAFDFKTKYYPVFIPPHLEGKEYTFQEREKASESFLRTLCEEGITKRYTTSALEHVQKQYPDKDPMEVVRSRLTYELDIITSKGMGDYLLIVYDFIAWAKAHQIPVGPGRGSGAGSIILYLIGITDIEPLRFNLFFERFINPERLSYPDIDVDICMERRQEVIDYTVHKYGKDRVAQIITFGTMKAKMVIKDVGRVLDIPLAQVNALTKLIPEDLSMTLAKALELDPDLRGHYEQDPEVHKLIDIALELEGAIRNTGIHAAGLIIGGRPLVENIPLCSPKGSEMAVTQFSMKPVEMVGLLKIDFLGLKTLSSIQRAVRAVEEKTKQPLPWVDLPLDDQATFSLLNQGKTQGVFQLESGGMQELAKQLHIDKFEEIIAVGALYRPGPMEMIPSFIQRKHGKEAIEMDHPRMADILAETYGIMVYQEQVMQIASRLANYSLGEGDVLRRAMGKKDREEMAKQREKFKQGALHNHIDEETSMRIFDKIEKFASYGFNKSHAAAYGYLSYVTAYLKANHPMEWLAAQMTSDRDDVTKIAKVLRESKSTGIPILPPSINESSREFVATSEGIRFAMTGIKGIGEGVVEAVLHERKARGPFSSLYNFVERMDLKKVGKKNIECFIEAGCFDFTKWPRAAAIASVEPIYCAVQQEQKDREKGYLDFFSMLGADLQQRFNHPPVEYPSLSKQQLLQREYELLGFYLQEHPLDSYKQLFPKLSCRPLKDLAGSGRVFISRVACIVESVSVKLSTKSQRKFAILMIGDGEESVEVSVWSDVYEAYQGLFVENQLLYMVLQIEQEGEERRVQAKWVGNLMQVNEEMVRLCDEAYEKAQGQSQLAELKERRAVKSKLKEDTPTPPKKVPSIQIRMDMDQARLSHVLLLKKLFRNHTGSSPITIEFFTGKELWSSLHIEAVWGVTWDRQLEEEICRVPSVLSIDAD